jgi:hypothetical protein
MTAPCVRQPRGADHHAHASLERGADDEGRPFGVREVDDHVRLGAVEERRHAGAHGHGAAAGQIDGVALGELLEHAGGLHIGRARDGREHLAPHVSRPAHHNADGHRPLSVHVPPIEMKTPSVS